ncbi:MAG: hypothetical protein M1836_002585 [Candelina mexicana]|nr:MAG: hypothetical protein M1836_002585 [Candelina mexicana]
MASKQVPILYDPQSNTLLLTVQCLPTALRNLITTAKTTSLPPYPSSICSASSNSLPASQTPSTIGIYCGLIVLITILSLTIPCLAAGTARNPQRQNPTTLRIGFGLSLLLFGLCVALLGVQAYTIQIYYHCNGTPVSGRYVALWMIFALLSIGCAGFSVLKLGLQCWKLSLGDESLRWIFPLVIVVGIALAPLVVMYCGYRYWRGNLDAEEVGGKSGDVELGGSGSGLVGKSEDGEV